MSKRNKNILMSIAAAAPFQQHGQVPGHQGFQQGGQATAAHFLQQRPNFANVGNPPTGQLPPQMASRYSGKQGGYDGGGGGGQVHQPQGGLCEACAHRSVELQRLALKVMMIENYKMMRISGVPTLESLLKTVYDQLHLSEPMLLGTNRAGVCEMCGMHVDFLKKHAMLVLQSASFAPFLTQSMIPPQQQQQGGVMQQPQAMQQAMSGSAAVNQPPRIPHGSGSTTVSAAGQMTSSVATSDARQQQAATMAPGSPSAAMFFAKAAEKFNIPKNKKSSMARNGSGRNRFTSGAAGGDPVFPSNFARLVQQSPPANPPGLFRYMGRRVDGKVTVMLRICQQTNLDQTSSFMDVDQRKKQLTVIPPKQHAERMQQKQQSTNQNAPSSHAAPKMFAFDAIFESDMSQNRIASTSVMDVLHSVINGGDGCLLTYGAKNTGKTHLLVGTDTTSSTCGVIPSAVAWLYSLIEDSKQRTGARFAVRVSAVEVVGRSENLRDLLAEQASGAVSDSSNGTSPGIYLREDLVGGVQLSNVAELRAATAEKAAFYLDAALASRTRNNQDDDSLDASELQGSHMLYTLHVYQYRVDKGGLGSNQMCSGGRSRLHLIDLSCPTTSKEAYKSPSMTPMAPGFAALGSIIVALLNGMKKVPYKDSKITQLLRDSIGNLMCRTTLVTHVSSDENAFAKTFQAIQMASKIHRSRRKRNKYASTSSDTNSDTGKGRRPHPAMLKTSGIEGDPGTSGMSSDYNTSSAGEDSCDTVIYMGSSGNSANSGTNSDQDLGTDNERPPSPDTFAIMKAKLHSKISSGSESDQILPAEEAVPLTDSDAEVLDEMNSSAENLLSSSAENLLSDREGGFSSDEGLLDQDDESSSDSMAGGKLQLSSSSDLSDAGGSREPPSDEIVEQCKRLDELIEASINSANDLDETPSSPHAVDANAMIGVISTDIAPLPENSDAPIVDPPITDPSRVFANTPILHRTSIAKSINVVPPLVIKTSDEPAKIATTSSTEPTLSYDLKQQTTLVPCVSDEDVRSAVGAEVPSEKELRKCEKRIAKMLRHSMDTDDSEHETKSDTNKSRDSKTNSVNSRGSKTSSRGSKSNTKDSRGSKSSSSKSKSRRESRDSVGDATAKSPTSPKSPTTPTNSFVPAAIYDGRTACTSTVTTSKFDGYISSPEACGYYKRTNVPVQAVRGIVRAEQADMGVPGVYKPLSSPLGSPHSIIDELSSGCFSDSEIPTREKLYEGVQVAPPSDQRAIVSRDDQSDADDVFSAVSPLDSTPAVVKTSPPPKFSTLDHIIQVTQVGQVRPTDDSPYDSADSGVTPLRSLGRARQLQRSAGDSNRTVGYSSDVESSSVIRSAGEGMNARGYSSDTNDGATPRRGSLLADITGLGSLSEGDVVDSDASPNTRRRQNPTTRQKYRWSTVYEENAADDECKKQKLSKRPGRLERSALTDNEHDEPEIFQLDRSPGTERKKRADQAPKSSNASKPPAKEPSPDRRKLNLIGPQRTVQRTSSMGQSPHIARSPRKERKSKSSTEGSSSSSRLPKLPKLISKTTKSTGDLPVQRTTHDTHTPDSRDSHDTSMCSNDSSSGIGSSLTPSMNSHTDSRSNVNQNTHIESRSNVSQIKSDANVFGIKAPKRWIFGRRSKKTELHSGGYVSDGNVTDSSTGSGRSRYRRLFARSKSSSRQDGGGGNCSGYETVTDYGETDNESSSGKKKKRRSFLGFRRRSTTDLHDDSQSRDSRGRKKRFNRHDDSRLAVSDDEGYQLKVYQIDGPQDAKQRSPNVKRRSKSNESMLLKTSTPAMIENHRKRIAELRQQRDRLKNVDPNRLNALPQYPAHFYSASPSYTSSPNQLVQHQQHYPPTLPGGLPCSPLVPSGDDARHYPQSPYYSELTPTSMQTAPQAAYRPEMITTFSSNVSAASPPYLQQGVLSPKRDATGLSPQENEQYWSAQLQREVHFYEQRLSMLQSRIQVVTCLDQSTNQGTSSVERRVTRI